MDNSRFYRRELKFIIPLELVNPIISYASIYCDLDPHSETSPNGYYQVNSLYLDTKDYLLLNNKKSKLPRRFNMRIRSYGNGECPPYFFEMKNKMGGMVDKIRSYTTDENWAQIFTGTRSFETIRTSHPEHFQSFYTKASILNIEPKILTLYDRLALCSSVDDYARVTFDRNLRFQEPTALTITPDPKKSLNYDLPAAFGDSRSAVIMELKCNKQVPLWMADLIKIFNLNLSSFSKYERSIEEYFLREHVSFIPSSLSF